METTKCEVCDREILAEREWSGKCAICSLKSFCRKCGDELQDRGQGNQDSICGNCI